MAGTVVNNLGRSLYYSAAGADSEVTGGMHIQGFIWSGSTTKTHTITFTDSAGDIVFGPILAGGLGVAGDTGMPIIMSFPVPIPSPGLICTVLGSGTVTVFLT